MPNFNQVVIVGNLTRDPEFRVLASGLALTTFYLAYNDPSGNVSYFDVAAFGSLAEVAHKFLQKGGGVLVSGRLTQRRWKDTDGKNHSAVQILASTLEFLGGNKKFIKAVDAVGAYEEKLRKGETESIPDDSRNGGSDVAF